MRYRRSETINYHWLSLLLLLACMPLLLQGCTEKTEPLSIDKLRLGLPLQPSSSLVLVATEKGYFKQSGLDVELSSYPSGKRALLEGLLPGKVDIALATEVPIAAAALRGEKFNIVASTFSASNVNRLIARKDAGIENAADIAGKRIATQKDSAVHYFLHLFLLEQNLSESDIQLSFAKAEALPPALEWGTIDAFSMREPYISQAAQRLPNNHLIFAAPGIYKQFDIVVVRPELQQQQPQIVEKFVRALQMAEQFVQQQPKQAQAIVADKLGIEVASVAAAWPQYSFRLGMDQTLLLLLEDISRWMRAGEEGQQTPNFLGMMVFDGLEKIKPNAITVFR
ncbi:ABC transporter substrate-binding protein [Mariprofundus sp. KV]|uniref:ABC transporter substrate-binding protein n=1 Tax=Mariprofundus sp. KV TaxID=2608715 RepID=UPI0015A394CF|nr:ABC transporter substrate-binding protein [Mariprofundus sp. KV]NWF35404.1 ABC transporter substrate-binding protein [Mariprofundus sp. KV]